MAKLYLLGTGSVVSDAHRTTTMLAVDNGQELLLVDCGGDAVKDMLTHLYHLSNNLIPRDKRRFGCFFI